MSPMRDRYGKLQGDLTRFPSGIKWLADQIHSRGLLFGLCVAQIPLDHTNNQCTCSGVGVNIAIVVRVYPSLPLV
jgi:hypothetical protein